MTDEKQKQLQLLSKEYKYFHEQAATWIAKRDEVKNQIKELIGDEDAENNFIKVSHLTKQVVDYKGFIADAKVEVPDTYRTERTEVRLTLKKEPAT